MATMALYISLYCHINQYKVILKQEGIPSTLKYLTFHIISSLHMVCTFDSQQMLTLFTVAKQFGSTKDDTQKLIFKITAAFRNFSIKIVGTLIAIVSPLFLVAFLICITPKTVTSAFLVRKLRRSSRWYTMRQLIFT